MERIEPVSDDGGRILELVQMYMQRTSMQAAKSQAVQLLQVLPAAQPAAEGRPSLGGNLDVRL